MKQIGFASFVLVMGMALPAAAQFGGTSPQGMHRHDIAAAYPRKQRADHDLTR